MKEIVADASLIARCGLYCGACGRYLKEKCPGCARNDKATWCGIRSCCMEHAYASCADCAEFPVAMACGKFNNFISKIFGLIFRSDRGACIRAIKSGGYDGYAAMMAEKKRQSLPRS